MNLAERFSQFGDEYIEFERIASKRSHRPDLHAFLLLDELQPGQRDIVEAAEHDVFYLNIDVDALEAVITDDQILELVRCGVRLDTEYHCLSMFA